MARTDRANDPERQARRCRVDAQAETIADLLDVDPETVMTDGSYGVVLTPDQMDALLSLLPE